MKYKILFLVALLIAITIPVVAQKGNADNHVMSKNQTFKFIYVAFDKQMNNEDLSGMLKSHFDGMGDEPAVFYYASSGRPIVVKCNMEGDNRDDFENILLSNINNRNAGASVWEPQFDREKILSIFNQANCMDSLGKSNYEKIEFEFHVGSSFWKKGCNESLIAALFFELNVAQHIKDGTMEFHVYYHAYEKYKGKPYGELNVDNINDLATPMFHQNK